jgi:hypothetical protein
MSHLSNRLRPICSIEMWETIDESCPELTYESRSSSKGTSFAGLAGIGRETTVPTFLASLAVLLMFLGAGLRLA